jgi:hypothetical protein
MPESFQNEHPGMYLNLRVLFCTASPYWKRPQKHQSEIWTLSGGLSTHRAFSDPFLTRSNRSSAVVRFVTPVNVGLLYSSVLVQRQVSVFRCQCFDT